MAKTSQLHASSTMLVGRFTGMSSTYLEYTGTIIVPYNPTFSPKLGEVILVDTEQEYIVARITGITPCGDLATESGEKWMADVALIDDDIEPEIMNTKVAYKTGIKLLGRLDKVSMAFTPGIEDVPHVTSKILLPGRDLLATICGKALENQDAGVRIGSYWLDQGIPIQFDLANFVSRRSFVFARAGYGKSNLMKIIASNWREELGGLFIFDPEGEYAVTDAKGRPGIMDKVPAICVSNRHNLSDVAGGNVLGSLKLNLKDLNPKFIAPILVNEAKHENIFFKKLMSLNMDQWGKLVDLFYEKGWEASIEDISDIVRRERQAGTVDDNAITISNNLVQPIKALHDPGSKLVPALALAARRGHVVILDISMLDSKTALQFTSIIVGYFLSKNQQEFIGRKEGMFKVTFAIEEAQTILGDGTNITRFVELAKEGRKYDLGAIFITQQPYSITPDILSQGDNFFVFHMISKSDLWALRKANAHFSNDVLAQALNEPVKGKAYMWSSPQPFVLPIMIENFEMITTPRAAPRVQAARPLLAPIVHGNARAEESILAMLQGLLDNLQINVKTFQTGKDAPAEPRKQLTRDLFYKLSPVELDFVQSAGGVQYSQFSENGFAIKYTYFDQLIVKLQERRERGGR